MKRGKRQSSDFFSRLGETIHKLPQFIAAYHTSIAVALIVLVVQDLFQNSQALPWHVAIIIIAESSWIVLLLLLASIDKSTKKLTVSIALSYASIVLLAYPLSNVISSASCASPRPFISLAVVDLLFMLQICSIFVTAFCEKYRDVTPQIVGIFYWVIQWAFMATTSLLMPILICIVIRILVIVQLVLAVIYVLRRSRNPLTTGAEPCPLALPVQEEQRQQRASRGQ